MTLCHILPERRGWANMIYFLNGKSTYQPFPLFVFFWGELYADCLRTNKLCWVHCFGKSRITSYDLSSFSKNVIGISVKSNCKSKKAKLATAVEVGGQKAPFSIATTPRCREGRYSFLWIASLYPWYVPYIAEC